MEKRTASLSYVQMRIERILFGKIKEELGISDLEANPTLSLSSNNAVRIQPDFFSAEKCVIGEIHTHIGKLKSAQADKIASDILKMILFERDSGMSLEKYIVICSPEEYAQLNGKSFLAEAIRLFSIHVLLLKIDENELTSLQKAVSAQNVMK